MSYEKLQPDFFERENAPESFLGIENREAFSRGNKLFEYNQPAVLAGARFDRVVDLFIDPNVEDRKKTRKDFVKMVLWSFLIVASMAGSIAGSFLIGGLVGLFVVGVALWFINKFLV